MGFERWIDIRLLGGGTFGMEKRIDQSHQNRDGNGTNRPKQVYLDLIGLIKVQSEQQYLTYC